VHRIYREELTKETLVKLKLYFLKLPHQPSYSIKFILVKGLGFGIWNLEFGIWVLEFGTWNLELGIWALEFVS